MYQQYVLWKSPWLIHGESHNINISVVSLACNSVKEAIKLGKEKYLHNLLIHVPHSTLWFVYYGHNHSKIYNTSRKVESLNNTTSFSSFWKVLKGHINTLTHWGRDKMAAVSQRTLSNAFSWMKMLEFRLKFHWSLFLRVQLTIFQRWFR